MSTKHKYSYATNNKPKFPNPIISLGDATTNINNNISKIHHTYY